jgi:hypothetical protein
MRRPAQAASPKSQALIEAALCKLTHDLLIDLLGVGHDPIHGLLLGGKAVDAALVAFVIPDDDVPAGTLFVGKGQHHRLFFFGFHHAGEYAPFGPAGKPFSPQFNRLREIRNNQAGRRNKSRLYHIVSM